MAPGVIFTSLVVATAWFYDHLRKNDGYGHESLHTGEEISEKMKMEYFKTAINRHVDEVVVEAHLNESNLRIAEIVLVGGSTRFPKLRQMLLTEYPDVHANTNINDEAVAYGATYLAAAIGDDLPSGELHITEVCLLSFGIQGTNDLFESIIPRKIYISANTTKIVDYRTMKEVRIYAGERSIASENYFLCSFVPENVAGDRKAEATYNIFMELDLNGILHISVTNSRANLTKSPITCDNGGRLPQKPIDRWLKEAKHHLDDYSNIIFKPFFEKFKDVKDYETELEEIIALLAKKRNSCKQLSTEEQKLQSLAEESSAWLWQIATVDLDTITEAVRKNRTIFHRVLFPLFDQIRDKTCSSVCIDVKTNYSNELNERTKQLDKLKMLCGELSEEEEDVYLLIKCSNDWLLQLKQNDSECVEKIHQSQTYFHLAILPFVNELNLTTCSKLRLYWFLMKEVSQRVANVLISNVLLLSRILQKLVAVVMTLMELSAIYITIFIIGQLLAVRQTRLADVEHRQVESTAPLLESGDAVVENEFFTSITNHTSAHITENQMYAGIDGSFPPMQTKIDLADILNEDESSNYCLISDWKQEKWIGNGTFGDVYRCVDIKTRRKVAGKYAKLIVPNTENLLSTEKERIQKDLVNLRREVHLMVRFENERILKCYGYRIKGKDFVIFTEYMRNGSVREAIRKHNGRLTEEHTWKYLKQTIEGLLYLHQLPRSNIETEQEEGVIHGDLKCDNILLDDNDNVKLADFGLSTLVRLRHGLTASTFASNPAGVMKGTLMFMAPEVIAGQRFTRKSDIWSLACVAVEMLTTDPPHYSKVEDWNDEKFRLHVRRDYFIYDGVTLCPDASIEMQRFLDALFEKDPNVRPSSGAVLTMMEARISGRGSVSVADNCLATGISLQVNGAEPFSLQNS